MSKRNRLPRTADTLTPDPGPPVLAIMLPLEGAPRLQANCDSDTIDRIGAGLSPEWVTVLERAVELLNNPDRKD